MPGQERPLASSFRPVPLEQYKQCLRFGACLATVCAGAYENNQLPGGRRLTAPRRVVPNQLTSAPATDMSITSIQHLQIVTKNVKPLVEASLAETGGLLRLAPCWVPRSFLQPGKRLKLHPDDTYAYGLNRGGIDERWFASTTPAANENRTPDEGLSYVVAGKQRFTLQQAVAECGATIIGKTIWSKYQKWPVYSKFFDNMGPIPHHMHQNAKQAKLVG